MYLKQLNDVSKAVDGIESKITEIREEIEGIEKVSVHLHVCCVSSIVISVLPPPSQACHTTVDAGF